MLRAIGLLELLSVENEFARIARFARIALKIALNFCVVMHKKSLFLLSNSNLSSILTKYRAIRAVILKKVRGKMRRN